MSVRDAAWKPFPEFGGQHAILYRSPDGTKVAGAFRESGSAEAYVYEYDEVVYCIAGTCEVNVKGGESFVVRPGDLVHFAKGFVADFAMSDDLELVTFIWSDKKLSLPGIID